MLGYAGQRACRLSCPGECGGERRRCEGEGCAGQAKVCPAGRLVVALLRCDAIARTAVMRFRPSGQLLRCSRNPVEPPYGPYGHEAPPRVVGRALRRPLPGPLISGSEAIMPLPKRACQMFCSAFFCLLHLWSNATLRSVSRPLVEALNCLDSVEKVDFDTQCHVFTALGAVGTA